MFLGKLSKRCFQDKAMIIFARANEIRTILWPYSKFLPWVGSDGWSHSPRVTRVLSEEISWLLWIFIIPVYKIQETICLDCFNYLFFMFRCSNCRSNYTLSLNYHTCTFKKYTHIFKWTHYCFYTKFHALKC